MKKMLLTAIILITLLIIPTSAFAQGMMGNWGSSSSSAISDDHTAREETEGKEIWEKLQTKQLECKNLTDEQYGSLGEYFMGQSVVGDTQRHAAMNQMMTSMMGEEGEKQMHIAMGKRNSGCDTSVGFIPMMGSGFGNMMGSAGSPQVGGWGGFGILGWVSMLLFWVLLIFGVIVLIRYLGNSGKSSVKDKSPLDILKERYAQGKIDKKEFEEMKKDLR